MERARSDGRLARPTTTLAYRRHVSGAQPLVACTLLCAHRGVGFSSVTAGMGLESHIYPSRASGLRNRWSFDFGECSSNCDVKTPRAVSSTPPSSFWVASSRTSTIGVCFIVSVLDQSPTSAGRSTFTSKQSEREPQNSRGRCKQRPVRS